MENKFATMSEVDVAYNILITAGKGHPMYYKDLVLEVIAKKNMTVQNEAAAISEIYTMINMDSRFQYTDGLWGLTDWAPPETKRTRGGSKSTDKTADKKTSSRSKAAATEDDIV